MLKIEGKKDYFEVKEGDKILLRFLGYDAPDFDCENFEEPFDFWSASDYYFGSGFEDFFAESADEEITEESPTAFLAEVTEFAEGLSVGKATEIFAAVGENFGKEEAVYLEFEDDPVLTRAAALAGFFYYDDVAADDSEESDVGDFEGTTNMLFKRPGKNPNKKVFAALPKI